MHSHAERGNEKGEFQDSSEDKSLRINAHLQQQQKNQIRNNRITSITSSCESYKICLVNSASGLPLNNL